MKNCLFTTPTTTDDDVSLRCDRESTQICTRRVSHPVDLSKVFPISSEHDESYFLFVYHVISISTMTCWSDFASAFIWHWNHSNCYSRMVESWPMRVKKVNTFFFSSNAGDCKPHKLLAVYRTRRTGKMRETWLTKRFTRAAHHRHHRSFSGFFAMQSLIGSGYWDCFRWKCSTFSLSISITAGLCELKLKLEMMWTRKEATSWLD